MDWASMVRDPGTGLGAKCLDTSRILAYPDLDSAVYSAKLDALAEEARRETGDKGDRYALAVACEMLARVGYSGNKDDYYDPRNSHLHEVIDRRTGTPISLCIVYAEVAGRLGLELKLAGFPGHVVAVLGEETVIDPFNGGRLVGHDELQSILDGLFGGRLVMNPSFLDPMTDEAVLLRVSRNLRNSYANSYDYGRASACADMALSLEPDSPGDIRDKGIIEEKLGNYSSSLEYLERYIQKSPRGRDVEVITELARATREKLSR
ncbi:conserved hypothetical protein [Cenarchaeum symbiosum A]|uniref:Protein SirB1 N-terminal domain-containing protein n=1 Tax=Cenarchaeum symbiosum (strain A) TaxID=414004 RepID=A0RU13_CENSY|nr:conserved hypothetical protein [Cenarchaeum symbiosum A]